MSQIHKNKLPSQYMEIVSVTFDKLNGFKLIYLKGSNNNINILAFFPQTKVKK